MFIEDLLNQLYTTYSIKLNSFDRSVVQSLITQAYTNRNFTEKQGNLAIKLLKNYKQQLEQAMNQDISNFLEKPQFKKPFRTLNVQRTMKIVEHSLYIKAIKIEFPYQEELLNKIRVLRQSNYSVSRYSYYESSEKSWIFGLNETNIQNLMPIIDEYNFDCDQELQQYIKDISYIEKNIETHLPMLIKEKNYYKIINLPDHIQTKNQENLLDALFEARSYGVTIWDNRIEDEINQQNFDRTIINFVKTDPGKQFEVDLLEIDLLTIAPIVKHLFPCIVIIPGGSELEKLTQAIKLFHHVHIDNKEMSVLFRLNNSTDANFNQFVKENCLNNPLSEKTKVVFLSQHIPKTILSPLKKFNSLLNFNYVHVHHKLAVFIKNQENVINILEKTRQRRLNFANL